MKPTQQEIIDMARELRLIANPHESRIFEHECEKLFAAARMLERFGACAGGGEPVAHSILHQHVLARRWEIKWVNHPVAGPLYTHPSPTDLRAEYLRGLEDAAKVCDEVSLQDQGRETGADECADAIRALKK